MIVEKVFDKGQDVRDNLYMAKPMNPADYCACGTFVRTWVRLCESDPWECKACCDRRTSKAWFKGELTLDPATGAYEKKAVA